LDENRLGQVELAGDRLHLRARERVGSEHYGKGIAAEPAARENVKSVKVEAHG
jgi:hypothetical protein